MAKKIKFPEAIILSLISPDLGEGHGFWLDKKI